MSFPRYPKYKDSGLEWLGVLPETWTVKRFQRCVYVAEGQVNPEDGEFSSLMLIAPNHIESGTGRLLSLESASDQGAESGKYPCKAGDVIYSKIRPALRKVCIAPEDCLCSADMYPLRAHSGLTNPFLLWLMLSEQFSAFAVLESQRVAMPKINRESLKEVELVVPSIEEQRSIVAFIESETTKIDGLISEQRRLMELLKEKRQAIISYAITKGLNPEAPMKPSGIEWLGEIPEHWELKRLKNVVVADRGIQMGPFGGMLKDLETEPTPFKLYGQENTINNDFVAGSRWLSAEHFESLGEYELRSGDLVLTRKGASIGHCRLVPGDIQTGVIDSDTIRVRLDSKLIAVGFAVLLMHEGYMETAILERQKGAVLPGLNSGTIANLPIALPPMNEQAAILSFLENEIHKSDGLIAEAQRAIDLLQERRTALISAAVTGQIDVRHLAEEKAA